MAYYVKQPNGTYKEITEHDVGSYASSGESVTMNPPTGSTLTNLAGDSASIQGLNASTSAAAPIAATNNTDPSNPGASSDASAAYKLDLSGSKNQIASGYNQAGTLSDALQKRALGQSPSLATAEMKASSDRSLANQLAAAGASRGGNQAALQRSLAKNQAASGQQIAQQAAVTSIQEQQQAAQQAIAAQQLQQQYIAQGMTAEQALQQARKDAYQSTIQQKQFADAQNTAVDVAGKSAAAAKYAADSAADASSIWGMFGLKDGGVVGTKLAEGGFPAAIMKQKYKAADGMITPPQSNYGISAIQKPTALAAPKAEVSTGQKVESGLNAVAGATGNQGLSKALALYGAGKSLAALFAEGGVVDAQIEVPAIPEVKFENPQIETKDFITNIKSTPAFQIGSMIAGAKDGGLISKLESKNKGYGSILAARRK